MNQTQPLPHRTHRKSRNGCARCKKRRVKCDERVPCTACIRHDVSCSLSSRADILNSIEETARDQRAKSSSSTLSTTTFEPLQLSLAAFDDKDCFVSISELMLHWASKAHSSMGPPEDPATMQYAIPRVGFANPFLLRGILAFSSFHLAYLNPAQRSHHQLIALRHQSLALCGLRQALRKPTSANCHALFLTSLFLVITKFAGFPGCSHHHYHHDHNPEAPIQCLVEAFSVCSGVMTILAMFENDLNQGPLAFMFSDRDDIRPTSNVLLLLPAQLSSLKIVAESHSDRCVIVETLDRLIACSTRILDRPRSASPHELSGLFAWPMLLSAPFLDLVAKNDHGALSIVAHYCVLIHWAEKRIWCFEGWLWSLMGEITEELRGSAWEDTLQWPLKMTAEQ